MLILPGGRLVAEFLNIFVSDIFSVSIAKWSHLQTTQFYVSWWWYWNKDNKTQIQQKNYMVNNYNNNINCTNILLPSVQIFLLYPIFIVCYSQLNTWKSCYDWLDTSIIRSICCCNSLQFPFMSRDPPSRKNYK